MATQLPTTSSFLIRRKEFIPAYLQTYAKGGIKEKVEMVQTLLLECTACPRLCKVNRKENRVGVCVTGRYAKVSSAFPHFGEEDCLRGGNGSGTIFFTYCNLKCVFCQNFSISRQGKEGKEVTPEELAEIMLYLQDAGCHNINLVTTEHVVPQIVEAIPHAIKKGLKIPIVYNTSAYDSPESLKLMEGIVDIYMPDFKFMSRELSKKYLVAEDYPDHATFAIREMDRQVGPLSLDEKGLALRGVLLRHLIMPGFVSDTFQILEWIRENLGKDTYINLMDQYYPAGMVTKGRYPELSRTLSAEEYEASVRYALSLGLTRLDKRSRRFPFPKTLPL